MEYRETIRLKDGRECLLRNGTEKDGAALLEIFTLTHGQTDYLLSYPDENDATAEREAQFLKEKTERANEIELLTEINGKVVGTNVINLDRKQPHIPILGHNYPEKVKQETWADALFPPVFKG